MDTRDVIIVGMIVLLFFYGEDFFCSSCNCEEDTVMELPDPQEWPANINYVRSYSEMANGETGVCIGFPDMHNWDINVNSIAGTGSMRPTYSKGMTVISLVPKNESDIHIGDIVTFNKTTKPDVIHRVVEIGNDFEGWYAMTKGDNNKRADQKMRFSDIKGIAWIDIR